MNLKNHHFGVLLLLGLAIAVQGLPRTARDITEEQERALKAYLEGEYEKTSTKQCNNQVKAEWAYNTDIEEKTQEELAKVSLETAELEKKVWNDHFKDLDVKGIRDEVVKRQAKFLTVLGTAALESSELAKLNNAVQNMEAIYSTARVCPYQKQNCDLPKEGLELDPGIYDLFEKSSDYNELQYIWKQWRDASGKKMKDLYKQYVNISNNAAKANGFADNGEMWRADYEDDNFIANVDKLWAEVEPLYNELHTYVKTKLKAKYGEQMVGATEEEDKLIPAHILGNMWAQSWVNIYELVKPFPNASLVDVTAAMKEQNYTARKMFEMSNDFYLSLGLENNSMSYGEKAMIEKPSDRDVVCHASAWDFCDGTDFRIKMCTNINMGDFVTIHHEMGHIQYYLLYKNQPIVFRTGANPGFHEAVGDTIALSVATPQHLQTIGLLKNYADSEEDNINALMSMALERVAFLPFGLLIDKWRWDVFSGAVKESEWNSHWWELRKKYQKIRPPVSRSEADFDPGAKYHVPADSQYIAYFIAHILEFQLHRSLCIEAGQYNPQNSTANPLHKCDIFNSKPAGKLLRDGLGVGMSKHWSEALKIMTGTPLLSGASIVEYFAPLYEFLKKENGK